MSKLDDLGKGSKQFTVVLVAVGRMPLLIFPKADDINSAIRKCIEYLEQSPEKEHTWMPVFGWEGRHETDYAYYGDEQLDYLIHSPKEPK